MANNIGLHHYNVRSYHSDFKQQLTLVSLFNFLQESAWLHASANAFGYYDLLDKGCFWALTRVKVLISRYPMWNEGLRVETWSKIPDALMAYRDFEGLDKNNEVLFKATSAWLVVDIASRRPQRMSVFKDNFPHLPTRAAIAEHPDKLPKLTNESIYPCSERAICTSDIDMNGHVNNANYVRWVIDSFPFSYITTHNVTEIEVNFMHESKAGQRYTVIVNLIYADCYLCSVVRMDDDVELARLKIKFSEV